MRGQGMPSGSVGGDIVIVHGQPSLPAGGGGSEAGVGQRMGWVNRFRLSVEILRWPVCSDREDIRNRALRWSSRQGRTIGASVAFRNRIMLFSPVSMSFGFMLMVPH